jgi:multiple sugar transport system substrate-binding protein
MDYRFLGKRNATDLEVRRLWDRLSHHPMTRRTFVKGVMYTSVLSAAAACALPGTTSTTGGKKQLRILQWSHFVPDYDAWFDKFAGDWGDKNKVEVVVDHIANLDLPSRMAAEVAAKAGHDLVEMNSQILTYLYDKQFVDMGDMVDYAQKKWGPVFPLGEKLAKVNGRWAGFPHFYIAIMPQVRPDLFQAVGFDYKQLKTWDQFLTVGKALKGYTAKDKLGQGFSTGRPAGLAISHCNDANHNWRAIMWAFGASEVAADGKTITVDSPEMRTFLKFAQQFYRDAMFPDVFAWDDVADNQFLGSGQGGYIHDAISSMRSLQGKNDALYNTIELHPPVAGPAKPNGISMPDANVYGIWNFAPQQNQDAAKSFLKYLMDNYDESFKQSKLYNMPMYSDRFKTNLFPDPKYAVMQDYRGDILGTLGYPGPPTYEAIITQTTFVIPDMVQKAVTGSGDTGVQAAIDFAKGRLKSIYSH